MSIFAKTFGNSRDVMFRIHAVHQMLICCLYFDKYTDYVLLHLGLPLQTTPTDSREGNDDQQGSTTNKHTSEFLKTTVRGAWKIAKVAIGFLIKLVGGTLRSIDGKSREVISAKRRRLQRRIRELQSEQYFALTVLPTREKH